MVRPLAVFLLFSALSVALARGQESEAAFSERTRVTVVDVVIEVKNPGKITPEDLTVRDDGQVRPVVSVAPTADSEVEPWRIVVYFDLPLATSGTVQAAISALAEQAETLVALGTVEVIVASPTPRQLLPPTTDPNLINQSLSRLLLRLKETDELNALRRAAVAVVDNRSSSSTTTGLDPASAVRTEIDIILRQQDEVLLWVADNDQVAGPRALFLVGDGFDLDPGAFYTERISGPNDGTHARQLLSRANADLAKTLSGYGWIVYPLAFRDLVPDPEDRVSDFDRYRYETMDGIDGQTTALIPFNLKKSQRKKAKARGSADTEFLLRDPLAPLQILADATGGRLVDKSTTLGRELDSLGKRVLVTFQATGSLDGRLRSLTVAAGKRPVRSPTWVRSGTPAPVAESRIRRLMGGGLQVGELDLAARWYEGGLLRTEVELPPDRDSATTNSHAVMRLTLGQATTDGIATFSHVVVSDQVFAAGRWSYDANLEAAPSSDWIVILVENLIDGSWGAVALDPPSR